MTRRLVQPREPRRAKPTRCRRGCTRYTSHVVALGADVFEYATCRCGFWYFTNRREEQRWGEAMTREARARGLIRD